MKIQKIRDTLGQAWGWARMQWHFLINWEDGQLFEDIIVQFVYEALQAPRQKIFVILCGPSLSGKSWLVRHHPQLSSYWPLSTNRIHYMLNQVYRFLRDGYAKNGRAYWERQVMTHLIRDRALRAICSNGHAMVNDSGNQVRSKRQQTIAAIRRIDPAYRIVLIYVEIDHGTLLARAQAKDDTIKKEEDKTWIKLFQDQQDRFDIPTSDEADEFYTFRSGLDDPNNIKL